MSKIDCYNTINFFKEKNRLTKDCDIYCGDCRLSSNNNGKDCDCGFLLKFHTEKAVEILQKWSDENPVKTRLDDFKEKYPNHEKDEYGCPKTYCQFLGYTDKCLPDVTLMDTDYRYRCNACWDIPV